MHKFAWIQYLAETSLIIALFYGLFCAFFKRLGHFQYNRILLVTGLIFALVAPAIHIPIHIPVHAPAWQEGEVLSFGEEMEVMSHGVIRHERSVALDWSVILFGVYLIGFLGLLIFKLRGLFLLRKRLQTAVISSYGQNVYEAPQPHTFSFGNTIYLGQDFDALNSSQQAMVLQHERAHVRQRHGLDLTVFHLMHLICWFHPVLPAWGRSLRQQHEFLADQATLRQFPNPKEYASLLLAMSAKKPSPFTHPFAFFILKQRINMLFHTAGKTHRWYYLAILPLAAAFLCSFSLTQLQETSIKDKAAIVVLDQGGNLPSIRPLFKTEITSPFGMRKMPIKKINKLHTGVDFRADIGTEVVVTADGTVIEVKDHGDKGYGKIVTVDHGANVHTRYAHLSAFLVEEGQEVLKGEVIAKVGNTGLSLGPHLHYEVKINGKAVDPADYFGEQ